ncbi:probable receptor-like protein kinase At5g24010 [Ricinus communis]|uniref:ATP binding protein, putative n=1 Tax=Ricinus communis TaxID=3988 RepID=B9S863_RICCO|nr:probable receptor-like protein kinase At5g24010 [Ricinus communis]EEF40223.1 ATP binding protein, putative [Ricinus communis]|eukprot:XP_002522182.1 probable receptor-like protein kinase At5g24010 [Ricinus communis]
MGKVYLQSLLYPLFLIQFLCLLLLSSLVYTSATDPYFINCGSKSDVIVGGRTFVGDDRNSDFFKVGGSKTGKNSSVLPAGTSPLYQTARIYRQQSSYELEITASGTYLVRLHFFPFISKEMNLSDALFNVSTSSKFLLFSVRNASDFPVIKEYFLTITAGKFRIYFIPAKETSFAFVNAIEIILLPQDFINDEVIAVPPLATVNGFFYGLLSSSLQILYRINVGGEVVHRNDDDPPLWREWVGDDQYLVSGASAKNSGYFPGSLKEQNGARIKAFAPSFVYKTCKHMNSNIAIITWQFNVKKKVKHFVRYHFCDIISKAIGTSEFELYIYSNFSYKIAFDSPITTHLETPYILDFVVDSDDSGYMKISIGPSSSFETKDAFLNGLEIMEFLTNTTLELEDSIDGHPGKDTGLMIGLSVGGVVLLFILIILLLFVLRRRRAKPETTLVLRDEDPHERGRTRSWITATNDNSTSPLPNLNLKLKMPLSEILAATSNFDIKLLIGEGGFGQVYKGTLSDGMEVAVKRSDSSHGQGLPEFQTEVTVLSKIRHRHLVSLIGYSNEGSEMILVYEFMEKGTLRDHLYIWKETSENASTIPQLTWNQRLEICIGAAKGLHYLHTGSDWGIIHRDVKSTNILLDEHYVAKVADFGLSQSGPPDADHSNMHLIGSFGYLDPEYVRTLQLTYKSDVYSFGVVLLEVLCARAPIINSSRGEEINLAEWGMFWHKKGQLEKIVDPLLAGQINPNSLRKFGEITERCLKIEGADRPTMLDVCWDLEYALQLQRTAVHREPHECSEIDVSSNYIFPASSTHFPSEEDCPSNDDDDFESKLVPVND